MRTRLVDLGEQPGTLLANVLQYGVQSSVGNLTCNTCGGEA